MSANGRFGGHIVSGHVDGVATIVGLKNNGECAHCHDVQPE